MSVLLERRLRDPDALCAGNKRRVSPRFFGDRPNALEIGLVNNMPDAALEQTEAQFLSLLESAADGIDVRVQIWSIPASERDENGRRHVASRHIPFGRIWDSRLDGLIVTGAEPRERDLRDEAFWPILTQLFDWARERRVAMVCSCLASHAAVLHANGVERRPLAEKRFGVFACDTRSDHPLLSGAPGAFQMPHSRWNELEEKSLREHGYRVLSTSESAGVDIFTGGEAPNLYFQGHPEYTARTLLREYRRDVGRFLKSERDIYPSMPANYFDDKAVAALETFRETALQRRHIEQLAGFPTAIADAGLRDTWRPAAVLIFRNWLKHMLARKANAGHAGVQGLSNGGVGSLAEQRMGTL